MLGSPINESARQWIVMLLEHKEKDNPYEGLDLVSIIWVCAW